MKTDFYICNGAEERNDRVLKISANNYLLVFGFGHDADGNGYSHRKYYDHQPTKDELKSDIDALINQHTKEGILNGFSWNSKPVYLSTENQFDFKAAYDIAVQTDGESLPVTFKLGEDADGSPVYHTFTKLSSFKDFYTKVHSYVLAALKEGWDEKDAVNYETLINAIED